jgi:inorganic pyrophosphatase
MPDVIIEIPIHSRIKYEFDKEVNMIRVDRYVTTPLPYPFNYGYFPNTLGEDGDPLDAILLTNHSLVPGCIIECSIIGAIEMIDSGEVDTKILVVPSKGLKFSDCEMVQNRKITPEFEKEVRFFLENYKTLDNKVVDLGKTLSKEEAEDIYTKSKL